MNPALKRVRLAGVLALAVFVIGAVMARMTASITRMGEAWAGGYQQAGMALQFARSQAAADSVVTQLGERTAGLKDILYVDFIFAAGYATLFALLALIEADGRLGRRLGTVVIVCAIAAGALDWFENFRILQLLGSESDAGRLVYPYALLKWGLVFTSLAFLSYGLRRRRGRVRVIAWAFAIAAAIGFLGLWMHQILSLAMLALGVGLAVLSVVALVSAQSMLATPDPP